MKIKQLLLTVVTLAFAVQGYSQGQINFANNGNTLLIDGATGVKAAAGSYTVGLWVDSGNGFELLATGGISPVGALAGFYTGGTVTVDGKDKGALVPVQVKAWEPRFTSYDEQIAANEGWAGSSVIFTVSLGGDNLPAASLPLNGLNGFTTTPVPEPSTIAFGILGGIGAMVLLRRRK